MPDPVHAAGLFALAALAWAAVARGWLGRARDPREGPAAAAEFRREYELSFSRCNAAQVRRLFEARARVAREYGERRMRLPNDHEAERSLDAEHEELDAQLLERIEEARQRCGAQLVHPGPVNNAWYGAWYRAANDAWR